jgi:LCP family protein required for cell wall assembly
MGPFKTTREPGTVADPDSSDEVTKGNDGTPGDVGRPARVGAFWKRWSRWIIAGAVLGMIIAITVPTVRVLVAWSKVERVQFDPDTARLAISEQPLAAEVIVATTQPGTNGAGEAAETTDTTVVLEPPPVVPFNGTVADKDHIAVLIIGSDAGGFRADVIMLALIPADGGNLTLVSLPRDLYLDDPCGPGRERINAALNGCGDVNGPDLLAIVVEDLTGVPVDHFVLFDFDGFARVINVVGGVEICVDHYTYDTKTEPDLALSAGCNTADGPMALSWVRSRHTRQIIDGVDQAMPGVDDLARNARQRAITLQLLGMMSSFPNPTELVALVEAVPGSFTLDEGLSLATAVGIAWDLRGTPVSTVDTPTIPVISYITETGAQVLVPTESFAETMGWSSG